MHKGKDRCDRHLAGTAVKSRWHGAHRENWRTVTQHEMFLSIGLAEFFIRVMVLSIGKDSEMVIPESPNTLINNPALEMF